MLLFDTLTSIECAGYLCSAMDVLYTDASAVSTRRGCCDQNASSTERYSCSGCDPSSSCCSTYEHCVSCCMSPGGKVRAVLGVYGAATKGLGDKKDRFSMCLSVCRTSSKSLEHENAYSHRRHHCFSGKDVPKDRSMHGGMFDFVFPQYSSKVSSTLRRLRAVVNV